MTQLSPPQTYPQPSSNTQTWTPGARPLAVHCFGLTDPGRVRSSNEDQFLIATLNKALEVHQSSLPQPGRQYSNERGYLFIVADGMGGHEGGERASALAVVSVEGFVLDTIKWFFHLHGNEADAVRAEFQQALNKADASLFAEAARHPELHGMGTTLTMAYSLNSELFVAHVGDSRCYLLRDRTLHRLTRDHTLVEEMLRKGLLDAEQAARHPLRHLIVNSLGGSEPGVQVEVHKMHLEPGDWLLLCSDGLTQMVPDAEIAAVLQAGGHERQVCEELVARANDRGGKDNMTVVVARYAAPAEASSPAG